MPSEAPSASSSASQRFFAASIGSGTAEVITLPIDIAKTRIQLTTTTTAARATTPAAGTAPRAPPPTPQYTGLLQSIRRIVADDGLAALWRGLEPALIRQVSYTGLTFVLYEPVRTFFSGNSPKEEIPFYKLVLAGGTAGGLSIIVKNPTDVLKTQLQAFKGEARPRMFGTLSSIYRGGGPLAFWAGVQPNVARCFVGNACELGVYDEAKTRLVASGVPDGPLGHFAASTVAGVASAIFSTPLDVVKTRLMAQAGGTVVEGAPQYAGVVDCFVRMPRHEGIACLYKGFTGIASRKVAWTVAYYVTYEQASRLIRGSYS